MGAAGVQPRALRECNGVHPTAGKAPSCPYLHA